MTVVRSRREFHKDTRGAWKTPAPFAPETFDIRKLGLEKIRNADAGKQQTV